MKRLPLSIPNIRGNEWRYVKECLDTGWVSSAGSFVDDFEEGIASYLGSRHAISCVNGTAALHIALLISGIGPGDEVIVPTVTFIAPVNAVRYAGADPVFMDCDDYLNMDAEKTVEFLRKECRLRGGRLYNRKSEKRLSAILPVHVFGNPVDIEPLMAIAARYGLKVIEDATESLGSRYIKGRYKGRMSGAVGDIGCLSFNGNKIITTGGGGMLVTNNKKTAGIARYLTTQAKDDPVKYIHNSLGYNYRLSNIQAALGLAQLEMIDEFIGIKRANLASYDRHIRGIKGLRMLKEPPYAFSNNWFHTLVVESSRYGMTNMELMGFLSKNGIETRPLWYPNHRQRPYRRCQRYRIEKADVLFGKALSLPCSTSITAGDISKVARVIKSAG